MAKNAFSMLGFLTLKRGKGVTGPSLWRCSQKSLKPNGILGTNQAKRPYDLPGPVVQCVAAWITSEEGVMRVRSQ